MNTIQILYIHGGMTFKTQKDYLQFLKEQEPGLEEKISWSNEYLRESLGKDFQVIKPRFPCPDNAKYEHWKIIFENYLSVLNKEFILIGNSLGGIFLAQYLSTNSLSRAPLSTILIAPPFDDSLSDEDLSGGFELSKDISLISQNSKNLHFLFSQDDNTVPLSHAKKYTKKLPQADIQVLKDKNGHFQISEFPEIIKIIKTDSYANR